MKNKEEFKWKNIDEFYKTSSEAKKFIEASPAGLYFIHGNVEWSQISIQSGTHEKLDMSPCRSLVRGSMPETLHSLFLMKRDAQENLERMNANPPVGQYKWWSTGALMNPLAFPTFQRKIRELETAISEINTIFDDIDGGNYEVKEYTGY